jgi:hypothetical protein
MSHIHIPHEIPVRYVERSSRAVMIPAVMFVVGLIAFAVLVMQDPTRAWGSYVANWLFFLSISIGALTLNLATTIVSARWNWSVRRVSLSFVAYLPIALLLMLPMLGLVREQYFPWIAEMAHDEILQKKQAWLNIPFLVTRNLVGVGLMVGLAVYFASLVLRPDMGIAQTAGGDDAGRARWRERLTAGWRGQEQEEVRSWRRMIRLAPAMVIINAVIMSMIAYDWAMSLEPHWLSTLFGGWFFMTAFWTGIAATALGAVILRNRHVDFKESIGQQQRHDLGKLAFGFTVFWGYLFWSQYLVIWYGKLPWEQVWFVHRLSSPWAMWSALTLILCFVVPFAGLISVKRKVTPVFLATFTAGILLGVWLERFMLVMPSLFPEGPTMSIWHPLITLMFAGPFLFAVRWFWSTFPMIQVWQPFVMPESLEAERHDLGAPVTHSADRLGPGTWSTPDKGDAEHRH